MNARKKNDKLAQSCESVAMETKQVNEKAKNRKKLFISTHRNSQTP